MCLQCITDSATLIPDVLPGYRLQIARTDHPDWPKGYLGLVRSNDPDFVWPYSPIVDPEFTDDEEMNALKPGCPELIAWDRFAGHVEICQPHFKTDPATGYYFVNACESAGWNGFDGDPVYWFLSRISRALRWEELPDEVKIPPIVAPSIQLDYPMARQWNILHVQGVDLDFSEYMPNVRIEVRTVAAVPPDSPFDWRKH